MLNGIIAKSTLFRHILYPASLPWFDQYSFEYTCCTRKYLKTQFTICLGPTWMRKLRSRNKYHIRLYWFMTSVVRIVM